MLVSQPARGNWSISYNIFFIRLCCYLPKLYDRQLEKGGTTESLDLSTSISPYILLFIKFWKIRLIQRHMESIGKKIKWGDRVLVILSQCNLKRIVALPRNIIWNQRAKKENLLTASGTSIHSSHIGTCNIFNF